MGTAYGRLGSLALLKDDLPGAKTMFENSLILFNDLGARWDIAWALTNLGKVAIAREDWFEAERSLKRAINLSLEAQAMPQAIDAALELADCFAHQGKVNQAMELILPALNHPAGTEQARQRAEKLKSVVDPQLSAIDRENMAGSKALVDVLEPLLTFHDPAHLKSHITKPCRRSITGRALLIDSDSGS